jgi:DNA polymerase-3 subunit delta
VSAATPPAAAYLVRGDDASLVSEALRTLLGELGGEDPGFAIEDLTGDEPDVGAVVDACSTPPFLADRRVIVFRDVGRLKTDEVAPIVDYLTDPLPTSVLVLVAGGGQTPQRLANAVKKAGHIIDAVPDAKARKGWMVERMKDADVKLDAAAGELIRQHLGEDIGRLQSLLDVLGAAYGAGTRIGAEEVRPFLGDAGGVAPWDLTDAIDRGDTEAALGYLHRMMEAGGRHPLVIMATLHGHFGGMLKVDGANVHTDAEAGQLLGMHPFRAGKLLTQARRLGSENVARAIELMAQADLDLRGVKGWSPELVLEVLVGRLSRLQPRSSRPKAASGARRGR